MTDSQRRATNQWQKENMTVLSCKVKKDIAADFKAACQANGTTVNAVLHATILAYLAPNPEEIVTIQQEQFPRWLLRLYRIYNRFHRADCGHKKS